VDLPRLLPSALVEQVRITPLNTHALGTVTDTTSADSSSSLVAELNRALGLSKHVADEDPVSSVNIVEAQIVLTLYLAGNASATMSKDAKVEKGTTVEVAKLAELLEGRGGWYPPVISPWRAMNTNPFSPSSKAIEVVNTIRVVEQYRDVKVTGIVQVGNQWAASVQYQGENKTLRIGDSLDQAKVTGISGQGITLDILGRSIFIQLGGVS
jgi:hypothetical protein